MMDNTLNILQLNSCDEGGGAEKVAMNLHRTYLERGHRACLGVGDKRTNNPFIFKIDNDSHRSRWSKFWTAAARRFNYPEKKPKGAERILGLISFVLGQPWRRLSSFLGWEDFDFPGSRRLLDFILGRPDIIHCHNLHGGYFDLSIIPGLSRRIPLLLTLHDAWLLSGHCAHSFDCERWKTGCGNCPDLSIYPALRRDGTSYNWKRKKGIYARSMIYLTTPSQWLMARVEKSILQPAVVESRVIPNGVDFSVFHPLEKEAARRDLPFALESRMVLFTANRVRKNIWKDFETLREAIRRAIQSLPGREICFVALGESGPNEKIGNARIHFVPYQADAGRVARYFQAADVYVHAAKVDTFPNTVLEALACGTPVVATAVGGIPEQVKSLWPSDWASQQQAGASQLPTGILVPPAEPEALSKAIELLFNDDMIRHRLGENAARDVRCRFSLHAQADAYLDFYKRILATGLPPCGRSSG